MSVYYSLAAAVFPMLFYLFLIWKFDRYDREPVPLVLRNFLWGAVGAVFFAYIGNSLFTFFVSILTKNKNLVDLSSTIFGAPVIEEITKGLFLLLTFSNKKFDNLTDGIVYGGAIGLGFGMTENFLYFLSYGNDLSAWLSLVIIRTLFSAVMHCVCTATFGAFLGYSKYRSIYVKILLPPLGLVLAMFIHFTWNLSVSFQTTYLMGIMFMIVIIAVLVSAFVFSLKNESKFIHEELQHEVKLGVIPEEHLDFLICKKQQLENLTDRKTKKNYRKNAITLAFRKNQLSTSSGAQKKFCMIEIEKLRYNIKSVLEPQNGN